MPDFFVPSQTKETTKTMKAIEIRRNSADWIPVSQTFGAAALHEGRELAYQALLSDRRAEGGGVAYLLRVAPPSGKLVRAIALARSDEHVYLLKGGYCDKTGEMVRFPGDYILNPAGHPHGFFAAVETEVLIICRGEPDEIREFGAVDLLRAA